jgi:uncharacterized short protein YbdD (DUF466 family)
MRGMTSSFVSVTRVLWKRLREWCGDAAYERYQKAAARKERACALTREQFYVEQLERKYSRPSRCC